MKRLATAVATVLLAAISLAAPAYGISMNKNDVNHATTWQTMGGAKIHGYVQIKASHNDGGRHARRGCYKFTRKSGPYLDTGWLCTASASSPRDSRLLHRSSWVWDSPLWGDAYVTRFNYKADWF